MKIRKWKMFTIWTEHYKVDTSNFSFANAMRYHDYRMKKKMKYKVT